MIDNYGINKFEKLYSNMNFNEVYSEPLEKFTKAYFDFLDSLRTGNNINEANYYFGRQTIFQKICPRYIGQRLQTARDYFLGNDYHNAEEIFREI